MSPDSERGGLPDPKGTRITVDMKLPLWGLLTVMGSIAFGLMMMYFQSINQTEAIRELQITVKAGNTSFSSLASEMSLLKYRVDNNEDELKRVGNALATTRAVR